MDATDTGLFDELMRQCFTDPGDAAEVAWVAPDIALGVQEDEGAQAFLPGAARESVWYIGTRAAQRWFDAAGRLGMDADLGPRLERLEAVNSALAARVDQLSRRLEQLEARDKAELADYERREAALLEFARTFPEPPDYGTNDPWEIARLAGQKLTAEEIDTFFDEE
ncbi:MAG: hypothetical protein FJX74_26460 [Armatimonadetes bacterium]|nr:hypothetical protein [Armatimonadota bacterium]